MAEGARLNVAPSAVRDWFNNAMPRLHQPRVARHVQRDGHLDTRIAAILQLFIERDNPYKFRERTGAPFASR